MKPEHIVYAMVLFDVIIGLSYGFKGELWRLGYWFADCELAWTSFDKPARIYRYLWSGMLQGDMKNKEERLHPTQKSVIVIKKILQDYSIPADIILDCFLGSGTTAVACKELDRRFIGIEKEPKYVAIAKERLRILDMQPKLL